MFNTRKLVRTARIIPAAGLLALLSATTAVHAAAPRAITVHGAEFSFTPNSIQLAVGQPVQLTIINDGKLDHDMKSSIPISSFSYQKASNPADEQKDNVAKGVFDVDFDKGTTATVTFTPTKVGTFAFICDIPGHEAAGMKGTFLVSTALSPALPKTGGEAPASGLPVAWLALAGASLVAAGIGLGLGRRARS